MYILRYTSSETMPATPAPLPPHWFQMLLALAERDLHGLGIMHDVLDRSGGRVRLWPAMLYRNLQRLERSKLIAAVDGPDQPSAGSPRYYRLTAEGRKRCAAEAQRLAGLVEVARARRILGKA
jgi:DNA-binding PadR family transcriptional regulator